MLTRKVIILSLVSFFADIASEMLYPIMPIYLKYIGFSAIGLGFLEGLANATAGLSKGYFGHLSDKWQVRMPFVRLGYAFSALSKPLLAASTMVVWVFSARLFDRLGKGIRTAARDAILAAESTASHRARVFGFHRTLDTLGATLGPIVSLYLLYLYPQQYKLIFMLAFAPGIVSVLLTYLVREQGQKNADTPLSPPKPSPNNAPTAAAKSKYTRNPFQFFNYWTTASVNYKRALLLFTCFALVNSADAFLLLRMHDIGCSDMQVIGAYIFYNAIFAALSYPLGALGDRWGLKATYISGLLLFAIVYIAMAYVTSFYGALLLFALYGIYAAATESIAKAWISHLCPAQETATAIGLYATLISLAALCASVWTGFVWHYAGATWAFALSGAAALGLAAWGAKKVQGV